MENAADYDDGDFLLINADVTTETGGEDGRYLLHFDKLNNVHKITLEEAKSYIHIENFFEQECEGVFGIVAYPEWEGCVFYGNIYDPTRPREEQKDFVGNVRVYHEGYVASYNRMTKINDYTVFYNYTCEGGLSDNEYRTQIGYEKWRETQTHTPEYVSLQSIEELLGTGTFYNDTMFVMQK